MKGFYTPDVAELIKPSIAIYLYREALEEGFEPRLMVDPDEEEGVMKGDVDDESFFTIMQERNPELFKAMNEMINYQERMEVDTIAESKRASRNQKETMVPNAAQESFLTMGEM
jgi:hypothetical protein